MKTGSLLIKNFFSLVFADTAAKVLGFVVTVYLARRLDPSYFGILTFSASIVSYFTFMIDPGLTSYGVKTIAQDPADLKTHAGEVFTIRLYLAALAMVSIALITLTLRQPLMVKALILIYSLSLIPQALSPGLVYAGMQKMEMMGLYTIMNSVVYTVLIFLFVKSADNILLIPLFMALGSMAANVVLLIPLVKNSGIGLVRVGLGRMVAVIKQSLPIGIASFLAFIVTWNASTSLLGLLSTHSEVGCFSMAFKICMIIISASLSLGMAILPAISQHYLTSRDTANKVVLLTEKALFLLGIPLIAGTIVVAEPLMIYAIGAKYMNSVLPLQIAIGGAVLFAFNMVYYTYLVAADKQQENMYISLFRALLLIALSVPLIIHAGAAGAAIAYTSGEFITLLVYRARSGIREAENLFSAAFKPLIASAAMCAALLAVKDLNVILRIAGGAALYFTVLLVIKGVKVSEIGKLRDYIRNRHR